MPTDILVIVNLALFMGLAVVLYSVRHAVGHHAHDHNHLHDHPQYAPLHDHPYASPHGHPYAPIHEHPYALDNHKHTDLARFDHDHEEAGLPHVHFWVRDGTAYIGARGFPAATYHCDVPGCIARCVHELEPGTELPVSG